ncbi:MAG TPA: DUF2828 domain-containing protein [Lachnospiraceae bacterium]|nr:DUF2828 domain-containing protein [Lachnospiraceae bacterium]
MNTFVATAKTIANQTTTENGAPAYKSTGNALVDAFGGIGALRDAPPSRVQSVFANAFSEDKLLAVKLLFYARNIRGVGLGERKTFRVLLKYLAKTNPDIVKKNIKNIPFYGRWDDMYTLIGTPCENEMWDVIRTQWFDDIEKYLAGEPVSGMAKWLKSNNTSSKESKKLGALTASELGVSNKVYRTCLSKLRGRIDVVEKKMCDDKWDDIQYENVPSRAMMIYRNAFERHSDNFQKYIEDLKAGRAKVNSSALYPYDIFEKMGLHVEYWGNEGFSFDDYDEILEQQWKSLPDYVQEGANFLVMADTSGSMIGRPMATSTSLAVYFAERNHGPFKNLFMTFSSFPEFVELKGETLCDKVNQIKPIVASTNLERAFDLVLQTAISGNVKDEDMPKALIVISDMEIDKYQNSCYWNFLDSMKTRFKYAGYAMPNVVMWNVESRHNCYLATSQYPGVQFASGSSPSVFKSLIDNVGKSAYEVVMNTLNDPIFDRVVI